MIRVSIHKNEFNDCIGVCCKGHAEYDEAGQDIVCAAVSVLMLSTINSIEAFTTDQFICDMAEEGGFLDFKLTSKPSKDALLLIQSLVLALHNLEQDYGSDFVQFDKEV